MTIFINSIYRLVFKMYNGCVVCKAVTNVLCIIFMSISIISRALAKTFSCPITAAARLQPSVVYCETVSEKLSLQ